MALLLQAIIYIIEGGLSLIVGYLLFLTLAACFAPRRTPLTGSTGTHRFAILVPAHNEEQLLPGLLENSSADRLSKNAICCACCCRQLY